MTDKVMKDEEEGEDEEEEAPTRLFRMSSFDTPWLAVATDDDRCTCPC